MLDVYILVFTVSVENVIQKKARRGPDRLDFSDEYARDRAFYLACVCQRHLRPMERLREEDPEFEVGTLKFIVHKAFRDEFGRTIVYLIAPAPREALHEVECETFASICLEDEVVETVAREFPACEVFPHLIDGRGGSSIIPCYAPAPLRIIATVVLSPRRGF